MILLLLLSCASSAKATDYFPALDKAKDAALIQSGVQADIDKLKAYGEAKGKEIAYDLGVEKPMFVGIFAYKVYRDKGVSFPLDKTKRLSIHTDRMELKVNF